MNRFLLLLLCGVMFSRVTYAQSLVQTVDFGPISATGVNVAIDKYTAADVAAYGPLTSIYVYITGDVSGSGSFLGNGGTPSISVSTTLTSNTFSTPINETLTGGFSASSQLASGQTEAFSFTGASLTQSVIITQNLANYMGSGTFNVNIDAGTPQVTVMGSSGVAYPPGLNANSAFPVNGTITISYNYPYTPVPEPRAWMGIMLAGLGVLMVLRKLRGGAESVELIRPI